MIYIIASGIAASTVVFAASHKHFTVECSSFSGLYRKGDTVKAELVFRAKVLQGMELYNGKMICYSLGNFCFGGNRNPKDKDTAIYEQTFTFVDGVLQTDISADMIPCSISSTSERNNFQPAIAKGDRKQTIIDHMNEYSEKYSKIGFDANGRVIIREE